MHLNSIRSQIQFACIALQLCIDCKTGCPLTPCVLISTCSESLSMHQHMYGALFAFRVSDIAGRLQLRVSAHPEALRWPVLTVWQVIHQTRRLTRVPLKKGI